MCDPLESTETSQESQTVVNSVIRNVNSASTSKDGSVAIAHSTHLRELMRLCDMIVAFRKI